MDINIYSVVCIVPLEKYKYRYVLHYVAGTSSEDAQRRLNESTDPQFIEGRRFINTDRFVEDHPQPVRLYIGGTSDGPPMTREEAGRWIRTHTKDSYDAGCIQPAGFREF